LFETWDLRLMGRWRFILWSFRPFHLLLPDFRRMCRLRLQIALKRFLWNVGTLLTDMQRHNLQSRNVIVPLELLDEECHTISVYFVLYWVVVPVTVAGSLSSLGLCVAVRTLSSGQRTARQTVPQRMPAGGAEVPLLLAGGPLSFLPHTIRRRAHLPVHRYVHSQDQVRISSLAGNYAVAIAKDTDVSKNLTVSIFRVSVPWKHY
jgi:hypothetical protein